MKDFDFNTLSADSHDMQPGTYPYLPSQSQLPSRPGFAPGQPQQQSASFVNGASATSVGSGSFTNFGATPNQGQGLNSFDSMFPGPSQDQLGWKEPNPYNYQNPISTNDAPGFANGAESPYLSDNNSQQPNTMQDVFPKYPYYASIPTNVDGSNKRSRDDPDDQEADVFDTKEMTKAKSGACSRCKNLKVKCEFKTDTDPCKRCLNGGHECVIPGRKKRRAPPKREHLLNQIREQAAQIKDLMAQLESSGNSAQHRSSSGVSDFGPSSAFQSPMLSPSTTDSSLGQNDLLSKPNPEMDKAIEDWIAKAKQSFEEFDVFIGIGGAGMPKSYLVEGDLEKIDSDEDEDYVNISDNDSDYEFAVEHHDGNEVMNNGDLKHKGSTSSLHTDRTGSTRKNKNAGESAKSAILPGEAAPFGLFGEMSLKAGPKKRGASAEPAEDKLPGIANTNFFRSTPAPEVMDKRLSTFQNPPFILSRGIITPQEAEQLFKIYFDRMNLSVSLLDPVLYTAQRTFWRSPFLFTVICAIASRFYAQRPSLYNQAIQCAQQAAGMALVGGHKNVEMCSAYILLSLYPVPAKRLEDQRTWLYLGLAIRTATDLNLHLPNTAKPLNENHARELLNRTRVWLNCFNLDRSTGSQYGKPPIISSADYMANHSENWWRSSPYNMKNFDIHLCAYNAELKVMAGFIQKIYSDPDHPTGLNKSVDFEKIATETDEELKTLADKWNAILEQGDLSDPQNSFRTGLIQLAYPYARLVALSYGFQHAFGKNHTDENPFLKRCLDAAFDVVNNVLHDIARPSQRIYLRHGPEAQVVFTTFASTFLIKLLQPRFASYLTIQKRLEIRETVQKVIDLLGSPEVSIDDRHGPGLSARFLKGLLAAPMAQVDLMSPPPSRRARVSPSSTASYIAPSSRSTSSSLSPAPRQEALSFESFAPVGPMDPFAPSNNGVSNSLALHIGGEDGSTLQSDFLQPPLPFDDAILHTNFNWNTFEGSLDMDYRAQDPVFYSGLQQQYMAGVHH
ncbi:hypothetical protein C0993_004878 [Termitomyces sp. T159_Od127]|nr:hypothetical protein C0993_004878 [Termitomyces sp. T159_Od127]